MKILGIIPARGGSKGIPGKNIKMLEGKPLLQYTWEVASKSTLLSKIILSTEDDDILKVGKSLGIDIPFKRPSNLSHDKSPTLGVIQHALEFYINKGETFDAICLLQVTNPFRTVLFLDKAIETFIKAKTDSLISVLEVPHEYNPHWTFKANENNELNISTGEKQIISRRQDLPKTYHRDGSIYLTKTEIILKDNSLYGDSISYVISNKERHVNIDTIEDWTSAIVLAKKLMK